jgi:hypothetical protein
MTPISVHFYQHVTREYSMDKHEFSTSRQSREFCILILTAFMLISLAGCPATPTSQPTQTPAPTAAPSAPQAPVTEPANEVTLEAGKKLAVRASATGANRYEWTLSGDGKIASATGPATIYTAPEQGEGMAVLTVIAYNDQGASPPASLIINIPAMASVRVDALAIPAGWMSGGGAPQPYITLTAGTPDCHSGADCLHITYRTGGTWGGIYWWPLGCGEEGTDAAWRNVQQGACGVNVPEAGVLRTVDRLTFWARGDQGGEVIEFKIGAVDVPPTPGRSLGKVTLEPTWKQYAIDLKGADLTHAIGLFAWIAADSDNPQGAAFYLEDIQFEGAK